MSVPSYIHLHNHTQYSQFDGYSSIKDLVGCAKKLGMSAVGITDHGTVAGIIPFLKECRKQEIRPILGCEFYFSRNHKSHNKDGQPDGRKGNRHLNIIAKNLQGYKNLCTLSQVACLDGYYYDPRIDWELLNKHKEGLIVTSACLSNIINHKLYLDQFEQAKEIAGAFKDIFEEDFYLEIMYHGIDRESKILPGIQKLSKSVGIKVCATNDCHYIKKEDAEFQQILTCMSSGRSIRDPKRYKFPYDEFYFKTGEEMYSVFRSTPQYMVNTLEVAEKCDYSDLVFVEHGGEMKVPSFDLPETETPLGYLEKLAYRGLTELGWDKSEKHVKQLIQEISDLKLVWDTKRYDFASYFLLVNDIAQHARKNEIDVGVRGSAYGSVLLHCLGVCRGVDPIEYNLLWQRFLGFDDKYFVSEQDFE